MLSRSLACELHKRSLFSSSISAIPPISSPPIFAGEVGLLCFSPISWDPFSSLWILHCMPHRYSSHSKGSVHAPSAPNKVNVHPGPRASKMNWRTDTPTAAALHRVILTAALAVAGRSGCRSTMSVLQTYPVKQVVRNAPSYSVLSESHPH